MAHIEPPKSPTLLPPRKSVELEDPGAHDLGVTFPMRYLTTLTQIVPRKLE